VAGTTAVAIPVSARTRGDEPHLNAEANLTITSAPHARMSPWPRSTPPGRGCPPRTGGDEPDGTSVYGPWLGPPCTRGDEPVRGDLDSFIKTDHPPHARGMIRAHANADRLSLRPPRTRGDEPVAVKRPNSQWVDPF